MQEDGDGRDAIMHPCRWPVTRQVRRWPSRCAGDRRCAGAVLSVSRFSRVAWLTTYWSNVITFWCYLLSIIPAKFGNIGHIKRVQDQTVQFIAYKAQSGYYNQSPSVCGHAKTEHYLNYYIIQSSRGGVGRVGVGGLGKMFQKGV